MTNVDYLTLAHPDTTARKCLKSRKFSGKAGQSRSLFSLKVETKRKMEKEVRMLAKLTGSKPVHQLEAQGEEVTQDNH